MWDNDLVSLLVPGGVGDVNPPDTFKRKMIWKYHNLEDYFVSGFSRASFEKSGDQG
jgi:hypothetical protein